MVTEEEIYNDTTDNRYRSPYRRATLPPRPITKPQENKPKYPVSTPEKEILYQEPPTQQKLPQQPISEFNDEQESKTEKLLVDKYVFGSFMHGFWFSVKDGEDERDSLNIIVKPNGKMVINDRYEYSDEEVKKGLSMVKEIVKKYGLPHGVGFRYDDSKDVDLQY
jgi:hypothetical protein